jgi:hypothetical protein
MQPIPYFMTPRWRAAHLASPISTSQGRFRTVEMRWELVRLEPRLAVRLCQQLACFHCHHTMRLFYFYIIKSSHAYPKGYHITIMSSLIFQQDKLPILPLQN